MRRVLATLHRWLGGTIGLLAVLYLSGIYSSAQVGALADKLGRRQVLWATIALMFVGLALTLVTPLPVVIIGMLIFTFGFFGAHSVASSWIGRRATKAKGQASSLYLFSYYAGSSIAGTAGDDPVAMTARPKVTTVCSSTCRLRSSMNFA